MLDRAHRLVRPSDFRRVSRRGHRASGQYVSLSCLEGLAPTTRFGFIVSKAVGQAHVRNRVKRVLRHAVMPLIAHRSLDVVIRAQPSCALASFAVIQEELHRLLEQVANK